MAIRGPLVNDNTLLLFHELLDIPDATIASCVETTNPEVELFLDFLLQVYSNFQCLQRLVIYLFSYCIKVIYKLKILLEMQSERPES